MSQVLVYITALLQLVPMLLQLGENLEEIASRIIKVAQQDGDPTDDDWAYLHAQQDRLEAIIQAPIPDGD